MQLVPALFYAGGALAVISVAGALLAWAYSHYLDRVYTRLPAMVRLGAGLTALIAAGYVIAGFSVRRMHWDDHCHRMGGVISNDGCYRTHSELYP